MWEIMAPKKQFGSQNILCLGFYFPWSLVKTVFRLLEENSAEAPLKVLFLFFISLVATAICMSSPVDLEPSFAKENWTQICSEIARKQQSNIRYPQK